MGDGQTNTAPSKGMIRLTVPHMGMTKLTCPLWEMTGLTCPLWGMVRLIMATMDMTMLRSSPNGDALLMNYSQVIECICVIANYSPSNAMENHFKFRSLFVLDHQLWNTELSEKLDLVDVYNFVKYRP